MIHPFKFMMESAEIFSLIFLCFPLYSFFIIWIIIHIIWIIRDLKGPVHDIPLSLKKYINVENYPSQKSKRTLLSRLLHRYEPGEICMDYPPAQVKKELLCYYKAHALQKQPRSVSFFLLFLQTLYFIFFFLCWFH